MTSAILIWAAVSLAQSPPTPAFEAASVKPSVADPRSSSGVNTTVGRVAARNVTLKRCMRGAYGIPEAQIFGGPKWVGENRYDIDATAAGPAKDSELMVMLQGLLAERFQLTFHRETRPLSGYAVVLAKGGVKAKSSAPGTGSRSNATRGRIEAQGYSMPQFAMKLAEALHMPVADATGIAGTFDFTLEWTSDEMQAKTSDLPSGPSIFSALEEQLGLKLEARKVLTEVLVIDRAELPSAN